MTFARAAVNSATALVISVLAIRAATSIRGTQGIVVVGAALATVVLVFERNAIIAAIRGRRST